MPGAVRLAGEAALRAGAGLVTVAVHPENAGIVAARPELICICARVPPTTSRLRSGVRRSSPSGPGSGRTPGRSNCSARRSASGLPMVVDADALNLLAAAPRARDNWILTPHPGEAARLLGVDECRRAGRSAAAARELQAALRRHRRC